MELLGVVKKLTIELDERWVLSREHDAIRPIDAIVNELSKSKSILLKDCMQTSVTAIYSENTADYSGIKSAVARLFASDYSEVSSKKVVSIMMDALKNNDLRQFGKFCAHRKVAESQYADRFMTVYDKLSAQPKYIVAEEMLLGVNDSLLQNPIRKNVEALNDEFDSIISRYEQLCNVVKEKYASYEKNIEELSVLFNAGSINAPLWLNVALEIGVNWATVRSSELVAFGEDKRFEGAVAVCHANHEVGGGFDYNLNNGGVIFRLTTFNLNAERLKENIESLIAGAVDAVNRFRDKFLMLAEGRLSIKEFIS